jgi:hypothetical protein
MTDFTFAPKLLNMKIKRNNMRRLIILATLVSCSLNAGQIHKWIDEDGNVHYGDAPPNTVTTEPVRVIGAPSDPGKPLPRLSTGESPTTTSSNNRSGEEVPADQAKLACDQARGDLDIIKNSARIRLKSADGTARYMTTEEIEARRENAEKDVARFCN